MKYKPAFPTALSSELLARDAADALVVGDAGSVRLGEHGLYAAQFLSWVFLPYPEMTQAYLRMEQSSARCGCRLVPADHVFLMVVGSDGKTRKFLLPSRSAGDQALAHIAQRNSSTLIGYQSPATVGSVEPDDG